ncbi:hypothetical protein ACQ4LE_003177 [Meloidogyne hapla]
MKLITLVFIQLCVVALVSSSGRPPRPRPTTLAPCDDYGDCPAGYVCEYDSCVPVPTTTTKKPTPPRRRECCYSGNAYKNCYLCRYPFICTRGRFCRPPPTRPPPPTTTITTPIIPPKRECCYDGNDYENCFECRRPFTCYEGKYCHYVPPTPPPTTTTTPKPPTPCDEYGNCPDGYKCKGDVCVKDY